MRELLLEHGAEETEEDRERWRSYINTIACVAPNQSGPDFLRPVLVTMMCICTSEAYAQIVLQCRAAMASREKAPDAPLPAQAK